MTSPKHLLFVSDLHLHPSRPAATGGFRRFLAGPARAASALYVLGDLFEAWVGDDAALPHDLDVLDALAGVAAAGIPVSFLPGNRDFLAGRGFEARGRLRILPDEFVAEVHGERVLLMHGDTLCTDDHAYQRYRRLVHRPAVQAAFLALPVAARRRLGAMARNRSMTASQGKAPAIMDVNPGAVEAALRRHGVRTLVHGHTHRPACHGLVVDGAPARRIVLGDWYEQGSVLRWGEAGPSLERLDFD